MSRKDGFVLFIAGDNFSGTGPAIVTDALIKHAPKGTIYLKHRSRVLRAAEILMYIPKCDAVLFSGYSKQNIYGMDLAHIFGKKCAYLMHGCVEYENGINRVPDERMARLERRMLKKADLILAVSRQFEGWLKENYKMHEHKISHLTNGVDWNLMTETPTGQKRDPHGIISVGGGMPRKSILNICKAIEKLRETDLNDITLTVAGDTGADSEAIDSYPFVKDVGLIDHKSLMDLYHKNKLFIQNSSFETFGLAPLEALLSGTDILISSQCGALSVIKKYEDTDIIKDTTDINEIAAKIRRLLSEQNHTRLICELDKESTSWKSRTKELMKIMKALAG